MSMTYKLSSILILVISLTTEGFTKDLYQKLGKDAGETKTQLQWNLSVAPTGINLPKGKGTAAQGAKIFASQCAACHGPEGIGASADPLVGEVGTLTDQYPEKTVNSYWPYTSSLFDYIRRSMPLNAPQSLTSDQIYALCAYILSRDGIIPEALELNEQNLAKIVMPNRDGFIANLPNNKD